MHPQLVVIGFILTVLKRGIQDILVELIGAVIANIGTTGVTQIINATRRYILLMLIDGWMMEARLPPLRMDINKPVPIDVFLIDFILYCLHCTLAEMWGFFMSVENLSKYGRI